MGHGIRLTEAQWDELDRHRMKATSADVVRNCMISLMSDSRATIASIAKRLGCGTDTVNRVRRLYRQGGVQALYPIKPPGRPPRATAAFLREMKRAVQTNPLLLPATIPKAEVNDPKSKRICEVFSQAAADGRRSVTARMWAHRSVTESLNVFDFTVSRHVSAHQNHRARWPWGG